MTLELFITILVMSSAATSVAIQLIKTMLDKAKITYKSVPVAVITAVIVGIGEILIYYITHQIKFTYMTAIYCVCMGTVNAVGAACGYDLVKKFICELFGRTNE